MNPSAEKVLATATAMKNSGLQAAGYLYVNLDDGIVNVTRGPDGNLAPTPAMGSWKNLSDTLHGMGFFFGVYTDRGPTTCGGRASAQGFEAKDAAFYASQGVDYVKEDSCNAPQDHPTAFAQYDAMRKGLDATGREIFFSLCGWNEWYSPVMRAIANSARIGPDDTNWNGVLTDIDDMFELATNGGPGSWNDPCLLLGADENGNEAQTDQQSRFQFTAWALLAAPMLLSQDVIKMSPFRLETYLNEEVIAVGQDPMGRQGILLAGGKLSLAPRGLAEHLARRHAGEVVDPRTVYSPEELRRLRGSTWAESGDGNTPLTMLPCASPVSSVQQWTWNASGVNYLSNSATQMCANTDDCGADLIAFTCITSGNTCCGNGCLDNMRFILNSDGTLRTPSQPGQCAVGAPGLQVTLAPCAAGDTAQQWAFNAATKQLTSGNQCLTVGDGAADRTAVIGRPLADGSWALGFFNAGLSPGDVVCDATCLAGMGFESTQAFHVSDLYAHADLPNVPAGANITAPALQGSGGVMLLQVLPIFDAPIPPPPMEL